MKKTFLYHLCILIVLSLQMAFPSRAESTELIRITVHNETEFLKALGSNRVITVAEGSLINLSKTLEYRDKCELVEIQDGDKPLDYTHLKTQGIKYAANVFDGEELNISSMNNLTIIGEGEYRPKILVEPRYAYIFNFSNCVNVTLRHLEIGHTLQGYCMGGVLNFTCCENVKIDDCDLYGCGTEGITSFRTNNLRCARTTIRDCSYSIMTLKDSENVNFIDCIFANNKEFSLVNVNENCINVSFSDSHFSGNQGILFALESRITMDKCVINHPKESLGNTQLINETNCEWNPDISSYIPDTETISASANSGNPAIDMIKSHIWNNGYEFVKPLSEEEIKQMLSEKYCGADQVAMWGGTLHEGGTLLPLRFNENAIWVDNEEYALYPAGDIVEVDIDQRIMFIRDKDTRELVDIMRPSDGKSGLDKQIENSLLELLLGGKYRDANGKIYSISSTEPIAEGFPTSGKQFKFGKVYEIPLAVLVFTDGAYAFNKTPQGLVYFPVYYDHESDYYERADDAKQKELFRVLSPDVYEYPLVSSKYLNVFEIRTYAGAFYGPFMMDMKLKTKNALHALAVMRNEIFARHGYQFKSNQWSTYFGSKTWYKPSKQNVDAELTDIEKANLDLIKIQERQLKKELEQYH